MFINLKLHSFSLRILRYLMEIVIQAVELRYGVDILRFHKRNIKYSRLIYICSMYTLTFYYVSGTIYVHKYDNSRIIN